jgi:hypothetical protein
VGMGVDVGVAASLSGGAQPSNVRGIRQQPLERA